MIKRLQDRNLDTKARSVLFDSTKQAIIDAPANLDRIEISALEPGASSTKAAIKAFVKEDKAIVTGTNGALTSSTLAAAGIIFVDKRKLIAGSVAIANGIMTFTPTTASDAALFTQDAYVTIYGDGIKFNRHFVTSTTSTTVNLGYSEQGTATVASASAYLHPYSAAISLTTPSPFYTVSSSGNAVALGATLPFKYLSKIFDEAGGLQVALYNIPKSTAIAKKPKNNAPMFLPVEAIDSTSSTITVLDDKGILSKTAGSIFVASLEAQGDFAAETPQAEYGQTQEGSNAFIVSAAAVEAGQAVATLYNDESTGASQ